jgi:hypothetical protein
VRTQTTKGTEMSKTISIDMVANAIQTGRNTIDGVAYNVQDLYGVVVMQGTDYAVIRCHLDSLVASGYARCYGKGNQECWSAR